MLLTTRHHHPMPHGASSGPSEIASKDSLAPHLSLHTMTCHAYLPQSIKHTPQLKFCHQQRPHNKNSHPHQLHSYHNPTPLLPPTSPNLCLLLPHTAPLSSQTLQSGTSTNTSSNSTRVPETLWLRGLPHPARNSST